jgi:two-component system phosphate regulon sensor histidine kinase PhoR
MLDNIVSNSIKYSPGDARISINATKHGPMCRIAIADRGPGIARHELASVRRAYYRGDSSKGTSGVGLGLYFVERIVEAHKGRLRVESEIGKGTTVVVDLPQ